VTAADPLHTDVPASTTWTTVNVAEAMPGVLTPLTWTFWMPAIERGSRRSYFAQGIFPKRLTAVPTDPAQRFQAVFYGRAALNPDLARVLGDLAPGTTGAATEQRVLGFARDLPSRSTNRRAPFVAARLPVQVVRIDRRVRRLLESTRRWWTAAVATEPATIDEAVALLGDARRRFEEIIELHTTATCVGLLFAEALDRLVGPDAAADHLVDRATTGLGELEELALVRDLTACAAGTATVAEIVERHGFHGPDEGQLQARSWRQDPAALVPLIDRYRTLEPDRAPAAVLARQTAVRERAVAELLDALPASRRPVARFLLRRTAAALPLREVGKSAFLMALDAGRHAATAAGHALVAAGALDTVDDVFLLTVDELSSGPQRWDPTVRQSLVAQRRERQARYETLELPTVWTGVPVPVQRDRAADAGVGEVLAGDGAAPGCVDGAVLVAPDLATAFEVEPGQIIVCHTTDPSWAAVFPVLGGIAVEVGSHTSHAAIVARELGLPCVVGLPHATERLRTGMLVRLDADAGTITVLAAAPEGAR
jgi:pyruvate,water dikinase